MIAENVNKLITIILRILEINVIPMIMKKKNERNFAKNILFAYGNETYHIPNTYLHLIY